MHGHARALRFIPPCQAFTIRTCKRRTFRWARRQGMACQSRGERGLAPVAVATPILRTPVACVVPKCSRDERPRAEVCPLSRGVMLRTLNSYPLHDRAAFAFSAILYPQSPRLPFRFAFPATPCLWLGGLRAVPRSACVPVWVGSRLSAGGAPSASGACGAPEPDHVPFGPSVSASFACSR